MSAFERILVPTDLGKASERALQWAVELALQLPATLCLLHVYEVPASAYASGNFTAVDLLTPIEDGAREDLERTLADVKARLPDASAVMRRGSPWVEILYTIGETKADLVVMGTHGRRGITHALLGSVAEKLIRASPVPVLTVPMAGDRS